MPNALMHRFHAVRFALILGLVTGLWACVGVQVPSTRLVQLPLQAKASPSNAPTTQSASEVWQLVMPLGMPGVMDRDSLLIRQGGAGLVPVPGHRWVEPLRDALPRALREDLIRQMGTTQVWLGGPPPGAKATRQIRVDLTHLETDHKQTTYHLRFSVVDASGKQAVRVHEHRGSASLDPSLPLADAVALSMREMVSQWATQMALAANAP